ncbi:hypothetical protein B4U79_18325 [Dinothrombium tinctorium]|uniref:Uncharacterized protein n=1 Tax=Dinothrombium tinctorium TaxID=1965070 RepID=A0A443QQC6_9ACAR|nr:hypothetical protein B4U79_18325 [Dinothrombium tinctorium]
MKSTITLSNRITVKLDIIRKASLFGANLRIPAPCIRQFGSCLYTFCDLFDLMNTTFCPLLQAGGKVCKCPLPPTSVDVENVNVRIVRVKVPPFIAEIGSGTYEVEAHFKDRFQRPIGCLKVEAEVDMRAYD